MVTGTREIVMTTTNKDTVMPCNAMNTWLTATTLRITCRNVVNVTTIILVSTDSMVSKLGLIEMYVYGDCQHDSYGQECGTFCRQNCTEGLCDDVNGTCTCVLGWKGDNCDGDTFNRSNKTHIPADTSRLSISPCS
ncbi:multiple epidermal growth factor-like domains protein 10 [Haliotis rubra]|uniref:multiple epidermal growth factor-like domains protein 10 n=1 Tax=Haliotis rubra TaxID=36100 RepID=UPI001EE546C6|nr:multiple epidermal growth factor-like domains protein 10 [Haliotis rubra]